MRSHRSEDVATALAARAWVCQPVWVVVGPQPLHRPGEGDFVVLALGTARERHFMTSILDLSCLAGEGRHSGQAHHDLAERPQQRPEGRRSPRRRPV